MNAEPQPAGGAALNCAEAEREIDLLIEDGELKETERALLFAHLRACGACKTRLESRRKLDLRLRGALASLDTSPDFTLRVLEALPTASAEAEPDEAWEAANRMVEERLGRNRPTGFGLGWLTRGYRLPAVLAALICIGLFGAWLRFRTLQDLGDELPAIAELDGAGQRIHGETESALQPGQLLRRNDEVQAATGGQPLKLVLASAGRPVATVQLRPGARLRVLNRNQYALLKGEAYFQVRKDRPSRGSSEPFKVDTTLGTVQVVGTEFGVIVPSEVPQFVTVVVDEGAVDVLPNAGGSMRLQPGLEGDLLNAGGTAGPRPAASERLAWLKRPAAVVVAQQGRDAPSGPGGQSRTQEPVAPEPARAVDWSRNVPPLDFAGHRLPQALALLAERMGGEKGLLETAREAERLSNGKPSTFNLKRTLPLAQVVRWLARESGCRFEASGQLRKAEPGETLGAVEEGQAPASALQHLHAPPQEKLPASREPLKRYLETIAAQAGLNLVMDDAAQAPLPAPPLEHGLWRGTLRGELDDAVRAYELSWACYDGVLWIAAPEQIARHTTAPRRMDGAEWLGEPLQPEWALAFKQLLPALLAVPGRQHDRWLAIEDVRLHPDRNLFTYSCGAPAQRALEDQLERLRQGAPAVALLTAALDEVRLPGAVRDLAQLARKCETRNQLLKRGAEFEFHAQSFVNRSLSLGRELEWAARLAGLGLRTEAGALVLDDPLVCYGRPEWQALDLAALTVAAPAHEKTMPALLAAKARLWFPELLAGVTFHPLNRRLAMLADKRQLQAVQQVKTVLENDLRAAQAEGKPLDPAAWKPAWFVDLEKNLAEPFLLSGGEGDGMLPAGTCPSLLRQSGRFVQLRSTLLVDPFAMRAIAQQKLPAMDVKGKTLRQVLEAVAAAVKLRVVVEDEVVWLRPVAKP